MQMYRFLTFLLIAATYVTLTFADDQSYTICNTEGCIKAALKILSKLNTSVDPCDNFYQFACGGWIANHPLASSETHKTVFSIIDTIVQIQIKQILEDPQKPNDTIAIGLAKYIYKKCMDNESGSGGIGNLDTFVQQVGQWPITLPSSECNNNVLWQDAIKRRKDIVENGLFFLSVRINMENSNTRAIMMSQPALFAPRSTYESFNNNNERKERYKNFIKEVVQAFVENRGSDVINEDITQDALDMINFEIELVQLTKTVGEMRSLNPAFILQTVDEWQEKYNSYLGNSTKNTLNWLNYFQDVFKPLGITILSSDIVMTPTWPFFSGLVSLLERTSNRIIVNYIQWSYIREQVPYTINKLENLFMDIKKEFTGRGIPTLRWQICVDVPNLSTAISYEFAKKYVQHENKEDVKEIIKDIANVVKTQIEKTNWLDEETKNVSLEKLSYMKHQISTPDWYSDESINNFYQDLTTLEGFTTLEYGECIRRVQASSRRRMLSLLRKPVDKNEWMFEPTSADAFYMVNTNTILITAAIMQEPIYDASRPRVMNYGSIGGIVGHEINHGFDNFGRTFDKNGNRVNWWKPETIENYTHVSQCYVDQYGGYKIPGLELEHAKYVNGMITLGENIGDSAGFAAAYRAYKNKKEQQGPEIRLPELENYSEDKIFFMSLGQILCETISVENTLLLLSSVHSRSEIRVRGSLSNMVEFSEVYGCAAGTNMNPAKKCTFW